MAVVVQNKRMEFRVVGSYGGFLPAIGLHRRGGVFYQESSYAHFWFFGVMIVFAGVLAALPWDTDANLGGKLKYWLAGFCVWGGICGLAPFFVRNAFGQTIIIDPRAETVQIRKRKARQTIAWRDVIGLQVCPHQISEDSKIDRYELSLVWKDSSGSVQEHCLMRHVLRRPVITLGERYESCFGFRFVCDGTLVGHGVGSPYPH